MNTRIRWLAVGMACAWAIAPAVADGPWYVATNGADSGRDGLSWGQAFATISNAVTNATSGTIYVSNGVYTLSAQVTVSKALAIVGFNGWSNTVVDGNAAVRCFQLDHASSVLRGLTIRNGKSNAGGGGVRLLFGTLDNCLITSNTAAERGGGTYGGWSTDADRGGYQLITNCLILRNSAPRGAGVCVYDGNGTRDVIVITHCDISSNTAFGSDPSGVGIWWQAGDLTVRKCRIAGNTITNNTGGSNSGVGVYIGAVHRTTLFENCEIVGNTVGINGIMYGGGMCLGGSNNVVRSCLITRNSISLQGGGLWARGGGIFVANTNCNNTIESCTIVGNYANFWRQPGVDPVYLGGSGIYLTGNGADIIRNCVVYTNTGLPDFYFENLERTNNVYFTCSNPTNLVLGGIGNKTNDPQFMSAAAGNYRCGPRSTCVNAGTNVAWMNTAVDLDGRTRLRYGTVDMGAYELINAGTLYGVR